MTRGAELGDVGGALGDAAAGTGLFGAVEEEGVFAVLTVSLGLEFACEPGTAAGEATAVEAGLAVPFAGTDLEAGVERCSDAGEAVLRGARFPGSEAGLEMLLTLDGDCDRADLAELPYICSLLSRRARRLAVSLS